MKTNPLKNALLADISISTSAAPTYLPAHHFQTHDSTGNVKEFNLIDGGVAANNPVTIYNSLPFFILQHFPKQFFDKNALTLGFVGHWRGDKADYKR